MRFTLNGRTESVDAAPGETLLRVLRDRLGLRSMKDGCSPEGSCGACTVIVDGRAVVSCAQPAARFEGRSVVTLEGLPDASRELWADAFVALGASQCGYCTPGIVMKAEALLSRSPDPEPAEVARSLAGNLCRCTGYTRVVDAIRLVASVRRGGAEVPAAGSTGVGGTAARYEGRELVLGQKPFVMDMTAPGMLHGALRLSDHPRALVRRIDTSVAAAMPGVVAVATARDMPGARYQGLITPDWPVFVAEGEGTRFVGDVLAAVAAETREQARAAAACIDVAYDVLEPVTDPEAALDASAPRIHPDGNLLELSVVKRGEVDEALRTAAHVVSDTFHTQMIEHAFLEPEACLVVPEHETPGAAPGLVAPPNAEAPLGGGAPLGGEVAHGREAAPGGEPARLHVFSQGQGAWEDRRQIASALGLPEDRVRVTQVSTGGGFGGKEDLSVQAQAALLAWMTGRPVHLTLSRPESIRVHPKRHPLTMAYTVGCDAEGHLVAVRARIVGDTGAYASVGAKVLERSAGHACGPYRVPNVDVEARTVYTNNPPCGAMRGFGVVQVTFALDGLLDRLADLVGIDGWEIRWRNALEEGDRFGTGQRLGPGVGLKRTLLAVRDAYRGARYAGIACGVKNTGIGNGVTEHGRAILRPEPDGTVTLYHSWTEMGQGVHTVFRQIVCEEVGLTPERVRVVVDTERELDTGETTASRATSLGGQAVLDAARKLRAALDGGSLADLVGREFAGEFTIDWTTVTREGDPEPRTHFAYGWATQVVILDDEGRLAKVIAAHDVGHVMNPTTMTGQVEGGVHMGLGYALTEELPLDRGVPATTALKSLGMIPPSGMPPVECILVEEHQPEGPYGAKGAGEAVLVPTAAAVAGALYAFDGIRRTRLPMRDSAAARAAAPRAARNATTADA